VDSAALKGRIAQRYFHLGGTHLQVLQSLAESSQQQGHETPRCEVCFSNRDGKGDSKCAVCTAYYDHETARVAMWLEREVEAWTVGREILRGRVRRGCSRCLFEHGWTKKETYSAYTRT
jgi:hypothetical protein